MTREEARIIIRERISCRKYLEKSKSNLYCCPFCGSGKGSHGTGAVKLYDTNTWTCHSCRKSGDVIDLYKERTGADYNTALSLLAKDAGIIIDPYKPENSENSNYKSQGKESTTKEKKKPKNANTERTEDMADYTEYYKECAGRLYDPKAVTYLISRGIALETAIKLGIGYDPEADPAQSGYKTPRLIIPTSPTHYVGRSIDPKTAKAYQKMNPRDGSPGIFNTAAIYEGKGAVFVTEGAFDAMSVCELGKRAIALNSTSNASKLIEQLQRKPAENGTGFIICLDNDADPKTAEKTNMSAETLRNVLIKMGYDSITYNICGEYKDPNEALQAYRPAFEEMTEAAERELTRDYLTDFLEKIQTEAYKPYSTELSFFDNLLNGGIIQQSLLVLMAAPGTGKTTLCQQIAEEMAAHKKPVIYINLEMSREQMLAKAISNRLAKKENGRKTALDVLQGYKWTAEEKEAVIAEIEAYRAEVFPYLQYNPGNIGSNLDSILNYLKSIGERAKAEGSQAPAVFIDYLHLISTTKGLDNQELIKQTVIGLKEYAVNYNTFVVGISATNRLSNTNGRITLESGRDSSNLEYTGDYQLSLNYYKVDTGKVSPTDPEKMAELQQMKWRQMIIRVLKGRFVTPGRKANVYFNAENNIFYGENDFMPVDDERTPFDEEPGQKKKSGKRL